MKRLVLSLFAISALTIITSASASAQALQDCIERATQIARRCDQQNVETAQEACERIRRLVAAGQIEDARAVAARACQRIRNETRQCIERLNEFCRRCSEGLGPEATARLRRVCHRLSEGLQERARSLCERIENCLRPGPGSGS